MTPGTELEALRALGTAALLAGEPEAAAERLRWVFDHVIAGGVRDPGTFPVAPDLVEALVLLAGTTRRARSRPGSRRSPSNRGTRGASE